MGFRKMLAVIAFDPLEVVRCILQVAPDSQVANGWIGLRCYDQLVIHSLHPADFSRLNLDNVFVLLGSHRSLQSHSAAIAAHLDVASDLIVQRAMRACALAYERRL